MQAERIIIHPAVQDALERGSPIVALESAVVTTGLPRRPLGHAPAYGVDGWQPDGLTNHETAAAMARVVGETGAVPAIIAIIDGALHIGLTDAQHDDLARDEHAGKAAVGDMAAIIASRCCGAQHGSGASRAPRTAGTTVSATLAACAIVNRCSDHGGIRVFATGGIGGVHRQLTEQPPGPPDVSADLRMLAESPVCVVCSGAKSLLDVPATFEHLQSFGVPIIGYATDCFPMFYSHSDPGLQLAHRCDDEASIARLCHVQWAPPPGGLGLRSSVLVTQPVPQAHALDARELEQHIAQAETRARAGPLRTPDVLADIAEQTAGRTLDANIALLVNNARLAGRIAMAMTGPAGTPARR